MFQSVETKALAQNVFSAIGDQWMLITAGTPDHCNTMTASWGGLGVLWKTDVATCYIRPQRHTYGLMEEGTYYTLGFFGEEHRKALALCGAKSGRDTDKIKVCGFHVAASPEGNAPYFEEAELVLVCRKLYAQDFDPACFVDRPFIQQHYPQNDYHRMYIGEIVEVLKKV